MTGEDLKQLGFRPGPRFKEILRSIEDAQLNGKIRTREDAFQLVADEYSSSR
jgi:poly(A) polymerase